MPQILTATEVLALYARYGSILAYNRIDWGDTWRDISGGSGNVEKCCTVLWGFLESASGRLRV
jgi:hypothetical protein